MGTTCWRTNVIPENHIPPDKLRSLIDSSKNKCKEEKAKKIETINKNKSEIMKCIKENNMKLANNKTDNLIKDENYVAVYDILDPILDLIKSKCNYIISTNECPEDLRYYLDSLLYATIRLDIDELMTFKDKISKIYGQYYIENAINDKDKKVNKDLIEKLKITTFSEEVIKERQNKLLAEDQSKVQYTNNKNNDSTKKGILKNFNNNNQDPSTDINSKTAIKENIINESPDKNKKEKNVMFVKTLLDTTKQNQPSSSNINNNPSLNNSHNDNKTIEAEFKEVQLFPTNTVKTIIMSDNQSNKQPQDDNEGENVNMSLFGKTKQTFYNKNNQSNEQPKENENNNKELFRAETYKTLNISVENPENKENPYEGNINDIMGQNVHKEEANIKQGEHFDPFDPNTKLKNPFGGETLLIKEEPIKQNDVNDSEK